MGILDWVVLGVFVVPTCVLAWLWATRDLTERSHVWSGRPGGWAIAARYWFSTLIIVLFWTAVAAAAAVAVQLLLR